MIIEELAKDFYVFTDETSEFLDHVSVILTEEGPVVVASDATKKHLIDFILHDLERLKAREVLDKDAHPILPNKTFMGTMTISIGKKELKLIHCPGHSYDSILIFDKDLKILIAGDNIIGENIEFFLPPLIPPDMEDSEPEHLGEAYNRIEELNVELIIPGHGDIKPFAEMLKENRGRYQNLIEKHWGKE